MENNNKEAKPKAKKPPSRLQKQAPGNLQLDTTVKGSGGAGAVDPFSPSVDSSHYPIPLLSPLVLSPSPLTEVEVNKRVEGGERQEKGNDDKKGGSPSSGGWHHPASPSLTEASTLFSFFESQCVLVPNTQ